MNLIAATRAEGGFVSSLKAFLEKYQLFLLSWIEVTAINPKGAMLFPYPTDIETSLNKVAPSPHISLIMFQKKLIYLSLFPSRQIHFLAAPS